MELEPRDPVAAGRLYHDILTRDPACIDASNALERLGDPNRFGAWMKVNCTIHPDDDIFSFIARDAASLNPIRDYLADGWRTLSELMVLLEKLDRPLLKMDSVLEFASGFGRFTRHLAHAMPGRVTCADVLPGSVEFVREQFGVEAFESSFEPGEIEFPRRYELVFVLSLLTHLPVHRWVDWMRALASAVKPGGLLIFTVHNEQVVAAMPGVQFNQQGFQYLRSSESPSLDPDEYGTTLTTRALVDQLVLEAFGKPALCHQDSVFWIGHDAVVIDPN